MTTPNWYLTWEPKSRPLCPNHTRRNVSDWTRLTLKYSQGSPYHIFVWCSTASYFFSTTLYFIAPSHDMGIFYTLGHISLVLHVCFLISNQDKWNMKPMTFNIRGETGRKAQRLYSLQGTHFLGYGYSQK